MPQNRARPIVLSFSGHDPSGGAGIQADIETVISHHCHSVGVITALTEQNTQNVKKLLPQNPNDITSQAETLLSDLPVDVFKIGLIGHHDTAAAIASILDQHPNIPVVLDPVLAAGGGTNLASADLVKAIVDVLLPKTTVLTPNSEEARKLTGLTDLTECGLKLLELGCQFVLITGTHEDTAVVSNLLFHDGRLWETYHWDRLPASYHGSGCTLASSIASLIAQGLAALPAIKEAQEYTWNALSDGFQPGNGQHIPNRFFWLEETT
ncbi:hydroxymethylpyrimidine/phosphomethylpyrimidine kinase [Crenothrix sp.]|uniref:bifunctional hydroxymethylpyrimidine kinase/phosphomethylpyrimidine kinase n=1 Tax=Crenothrix sp. TaxID=3100433 RepID=UPI00374D6CCC